MPSLASLISPWTVAAVVALLFVIASLIAPDIAGNTAKVFEDFSGSLSRFAAARWKYVEKIWSFSGEKAKQERRINDAVQAEVARRYVLLKQSGAPLPTNASVVTPTELAAIRVGETARLGGEPKDPEDADISQAWVRRLTYLVLVLVCAASDYVLASSRTPLLFGGGATPSWLVFLFRYLQIITGILFVSIAILSGMIIQEFIDKDLAPVVKLSPNLSFPWKWIFLSLAIVMFLTDIVVIVSLTIAGIDFTYHLPLDVALFFVIFVGATLVIALALLLGFQGLLDGVMGVGSLIFLGLVALVMQIVRAVFATIGAVFRALSIAQLALSGMFQRDVEKPRDIQKPDDKDITIIGYGEVGSRYAVEICEQLGQLFARLRYAWIAGFAGAKGPDRVRYSNRLHRAGAAAQIFSAKTLDSLMSDLKNRFASKPEEKTVLLVVSGEDLRVAITEFKQWDTLEEIKNVKLVILWRTPSRADTALNEVKALANELNQWAADPNSMLTTTIVVESDSPGERAMAAQSEGLLTRSVAALLLGPTAFGGARTSFVEVMKQFKNKGIPFVTLASAAVGTDIAGEAFQNGDARGAKGDIDGNLASIRLKKLAAMVFLHPGANVSANLGSLWSVTDPGAALSQKDLAATPGVTLWSAQQANTFVNVIAPTRLRTGEATRTFVNALSRWLQDLYRIPAGQLAVERILNPRDTGVKPNINGATVELKGKVYFHFTAVRGVVDAQGKASIPAVLAGGATPPVGAMPNAAQAGAAQPAPAQPAPAQAGAGPIPVGVGQAGPAPYQQPQAGPAPYQAPQAGPIPAGAGQAQAGPIPYDPDH